MAPRPRDLCVSLMLSLLGACTGAITDAAPRAGEEQPPIPGSPEYCQEVTAEPGHVTLRRLNRTEFNNTVRDLLGTSQTPADAFPEDDESGDGFDNNGAILSLGDLLMEKYETAARELSLGALSAGSPLRERYLDCDAETRGETPCARDFIERFGLRAYRRPLDTREADRLVALYESARVEGEPHAEALEQTIRGILMSPNFLFRIELGAESPDVHRLGDFELASRLSYFLWQSMPDEELLARADDGLLQDAEELRVQVDRMLADEKSDAFFLNFAGQWLQLRRFAYATPNTDLFPEFDEALRAAMTRETLLFVRHVVETNAPVSTLLRADFTYLDERLAAHYGIDGVVGPEFRYVALDTSERGGILTQGAILTTTSHPDTTSPVRRGEWVLDNLLCSPPPDPPADVDTFIQTEDNAGLSLRRKLEEHRANPSCAACHDLMDPIGFGMENFDPIGRYRTEDRDGNPIDSSGELPDGTSFIGVAELSGILHQDSRYTVCVTEKVLTFALGRSLDTEDRCFVEEIVAEADTTGISLREIITQVVLNEVFRSAGGREDGP